MSDIKKYKVSIPIYKGYVVIIQCEDLSLLEKTYELSSVKGFDAFVFSREIGNNGFIEYVMAFTNPTNVGVIAHESVHFINLLFSDRSIELSLTNDEPQAYLMEWIVKECVKRVKVD